MPLIGISDTGKLMLLLRLLVGPFAHHLLLGAHLPDQLPHACARSSTTSPVLSLKNGSSIFSLKSVSERTVEKGKRSAAARCQ